MLKDIPYNVLKQDGRAYEIMLLRDQYNNRFADIAKEFGISGARVVQIYRRIKYRQMKLYINHIAFTLGHENTIQIRTVFQDAYECYQDVTYACAYLEKKYASALSAYRGGEPGMPMAFIKNMPPFRAKVSKKAIARIIEMRETEKASFAKIAEEMHLTREKAKRSYEMFYHRKVLEIMEKRQKKAESREERRAIWEDCLGGREPAEKRYERLARETECGDAELTQK